jgi:hypothetical protein
MCRGRLVQGGRERERLLRLLFQTMERTRIIKRGMERKGKLARRISFDVCGPWSVGMFPFETHVHLDH